MKAKQEEVQVYGGGLQGKALRNIDLKRLLTAQTCCPRGALGQLTALEGAGLRHCSVAPDMDRWACYHSGEVWVEVVEGANLAQSHHWAELPACSAGRDKMQTHFQINFNMDWEKSYKPFMLNKEGGKHEQHKKRVSPTPKLTMQVWVFASFYIL